MIHSVFAPDSEGWSSRTRLKERFKTRIHHWGFDKNLLSLFEFRMLCIRHCLEDNLFCFGFKMVSFTSLLFPVSFGFFFVKQNHLWNVPDVTKLAPIFSMCRKAENLLTWFPELTASMTTWALIFRSIKSCTVHWMQACASIPQIKTSLKYS